MPTLSRKSAAALAGALLSAALLAPGAHAQVNTPPDATAAPPPPSPPAAPPAPDAATTTAPAETAPAPTAAPTEAAPAPTPAPAAAPAPVLPAPEPSPDQDKPHSSRFRIGPTIGFYLPTDSKTRDRFGSSWFSVGLGIGPVSSITSKGSLGFDINLLYQTHNDNRVLLIPLGLGYRVALTQDAAAKTVPYAGITADYYLENFKSIPENINGTFGAGGGSVLLGVNFGQSANLEARYQFVSRTRGFDFSGLNLTAGYRF